VNIQRHKIFLSLILFLIFLLFIAFIFILIKWVPGQTELVFGESDQDLDISERMVLSTKLLLNRKHLIEAQISRSDPIPFLIEPGQSATEIAQTLASQGVISDADMLITYWKYKGTDHLIQTGVYMIKPGAWMTANDIVRIGSVPPFQGVTLSHTPDTPFGWVLSYLSSGPVETKRTPGYQVDDYTGHTLNNHDIIQVYAEEKVGEDEWYMVGPEEWVHQKVVARVIPNTTPPEGVPGDRWIEINLYEQTVSVYDTGELVYATLIASGLEPLWTRPGLFQIYEKYEMTPMRGSFAADRSDAYYLEDVPWTMYFDQARALHGAYWRANLGFPQSHGCVNMSVGDSRWIFDWADIGDWIYVWDPSGKTPADPTLYTAGGA